MTSEARKLWLAKMKPTEAYKQQQRKRVSLWAKNNAGIARARQAMWKARKRHAVPPWANKFFMQEIYDLAVRRSKCLGKLYVVDHIVPMQSPLVCGLHWEGNLQILDARSNLAKYNRHWPDMP